MVVADAVVRFRGDSRDIDKTLDGIPGRAAGPAGKVGGAFRNALRNGITAGGAGLGAIAVGAVQSSAELADKMATVNTVAKLTDAQLADLTGKVQALSAETGQSTDDLAAGLYDLVSAGIPANKAISVLRASTVLAKGSLASTAEAVDLTTTALNAYGLQADQAGKVTDVMAQAVADGKVTAAQLAASFGQIGPIAASAGVSMQEVAAGYAILSAKGVPAAEAATEMRAAIQALLNPNKQLEQLQIETGKNFAAEVKAGKPLSAVLDEIRVAAAKNGDAMAKLAGVSAKDFPAALKSMQKQLNLSNADLKKFGDEAGKEGVTRALQDLQKQVGAGNSAFVSSLGSVEAYQFALASTGPNSKQFASETQKMYHSSGAAADAYAKKMDSPIEKAKQFAAKITTLGQQAGAAAAPIAPLLLTVNQLGPAFGGVLTAGQALGGVLGGLSARAIASNVAMVAARVGALAWTAAQWLLNIALDANPIGLVVLAIAALVAGFIWAYQNIKPFRDFVNYLWQEIVQLWHWIVGGSPGLIPALNALVGVVKFVLAVALAPMRFELALVQAAVGFLWQTFTRFVGWLAGVPGQLASWGKQLLAVLLDPIKNFGPNLAILIQRALQGLNINIGPYHISAKGIRIDLPGGGHVGTYAQGTPFVPQDMLAFLHRGEMVVPAYESNLIRGGQAALAPGVAAASPGGAQITVNVYNPRPEPAGTSAVRELRKLAFTGQLA